MRIAVVGAGAMGSIFGTALVRGGDEVTLVDVAQPLVDKINADGVTVVRGDDRSTSRVPATNDPTSVGVVDARHLLRQVLPHRRGGRARAAARGAGHGRRLAPERVGERRRARRRLRPRAGGRRRHVQQRHRRRAGHGHPPRRPADVSSAPSRTATRRRRAIARGARARRARGHVTSPVRPEIWKKLILNAATLPTAALTGHERRRADAHAQMRELVAEVAREATAVAQALATRSTRTSGSTRSSRCSSGRGRRRASMLQDFEAGRRTEIDVINGAVVARRRRAGRRRPLNRAFVALVKGWESTRGLA